MPPQDLLEALEGNGLPPVRNTICIAWPWAVDLKRNLIVCRPGEAVMIGPWEHLVILRALLDDDVIAFTNHA